VQIAIPLYDGMTALDAIGPYDVLGRLPGATVVFTGERKGPVRNDLGNEFLTVEKVFAEVSSPDIVVVPGGTDVLSHVDDDAEILSWLRAVDATTTWTTSVCTGALILAKAGLLTGRRATTHWASVQTLADLGAVPVTERVVSDGKYVTGAGVSAGLDFALTLVGTIAGDEVAQAIQLGIEYDPEPPYHAGSVATAPPELVAFVRELLNPVHPM
jgi:putative intracellular protease/amidase